jgi:uncharacterized protein (DUF362 family)
MEIDSASVKDPRVAFSTVGSTTYPSELQESSSLDGALRRCCDVLEWSEEGRGAFGRVIREGDRVVVKPNLVLHANQGTAGLLPLVTNRAVIASTVREILKAKPRSVVVGDAPIQLCDWSKLLAETGLGEWAASLMSEPLFGGLKDFRRTICEYVDGVRVAKENMRPADDYVLFNLGVDSLLEPITQYEGIFRVTSYDPQLLAKTHSPGNHQYLIAKEILEADVVVNLPKLKTHKKAGISCALKNLVGINGNKEYLPHHRVGGSSEGGDCYPGRDRIKRTLERLFDERNRSDSKFDAGSIHFVEKQLYRMLRLKGDRTGVEGAWSGNETVARMTIDLNRVLLYGRTDGEIADTLQRRVLNVVDAVVAGQGDGPLANDELPLGMILAGSNQAAVDVIGARLLGYQPARIPTLELAFGDYRWPITAFGEEAVAEVDADIGSAAERGVGRTASSTDVHHPAGWSDAIAKPEGAQVG